MRHSPIVQAVIDAGPYDETWESLSALYAPRSGTATPSSASSSTGASTPSRRSATSGIPATCTAQGTPEFEHHVATYGPHASSATRTSSPLHDGAVRPRRVGRAVPARRARSSSCRSPSTTTASRCTTPHRSRWSAAQMGPAARRDRRARAPRPTGHGWSLGASSPPRRALVLHERRERSSTPTCTIRAYADFYGPAQREETAPNERFLEDWLLRTVELVDRYRPQVLWFDWWIEQPAFKPYVCDARRVLLQPRRGVGPRGRHQLQVGGLRPGHAPCSTSSAARWPASARRSGRTTPSVSKTSWS